MLSPWYKIAKECVALRKNVLRVDLCLFIDPQESFANKDFLNSTIKSMLTASIINGLDVIGILSPNDPTVGLLAAKMALDQKMDIHVLPGQTYICADKEELYIYKVVSQLPKNLTIDKACEFAHKQGGFVVASNVTKKLGLKINKLQGSIYAPDGVEIFNAKVGGYRDIDVDFSRFINSGATSASDLESTNVFTLVERHKAVEMGLIPEEKGVDYTPKYLLPQENR
jgi:hypothetical protein